MNDKQQIFIVTSGEYSDYTIERVFSTREKAMEYLDTQDDDYRLEVYDIDAPIERRTKLYRISFSLEKKAAAEVTLHWSLSLKDLICARTAFGTGKKVLDIYVESDSRKRALKIASERYGAVIAGEKSMYPFLRVEVLRCYDERIPAYFDFKTGDLVLFEGQELCMELPSFIKVRKMNGRPL